MLKPSIFVDALNIWSFMMIALGITGEYDGQLLMKLGTSCWGI